MKVLVTGGVRSGKSRHAEALFGPEDAVAYVAPGPLVAVTNVVGLGVVPAHRSGRVFRDVLGQVNQAVAAASDRVTLVVASRTLHL